MENNPAKVTLVRPPAMEAFRFSTASVSPPLGLAYIAAALETAGHDVNVIDAVAEAPRRHTRYFKGYAIGLRVPEIVARIPSDSTVVGITVVFTHEWPMAAELVRRIKAARPELIVMLGGEHVTAMPEFCLLTSPADYLILGEGEERNKLENLIKKLNLQEKVYLLEK